MLNTGEDRLQSIVISLTDGIEFVVVAAGTTGGKSQKGRPGRIDHVVQFVHPLLKTELRVLPFYLIIGACHQKAGGDIRSQCVSCDLLAHKLVVRLVVVKRADDPVAVLPRVGTLAVHFIPVCFSKTNKVQPVTAPTLTVVWTGEHLFHQSWPCCCAVVVDEGIHLLGAGRKPQHHEKQSTNQGPTICLG